MHGCAPCLSVFVFVFFAFVFNAVVGLYLVYLVDVEGAHGDDDEHAEPAVVEEVGASHAGEDADDDDEQHVYLVFHKIFFHSDFPPDYVL